MPLVAYKGVHGNTDYPHHFAFFSALRERGILNEVQFALDPVPLMDVQYCHKLIAEFPELCMASSVSLPRKMVELLRTNLNRGYRIPAFVDYKWDAVIEGPGGRINHTYCKTDVFRLYPNTKHRAIIFHSIEKKALENATVRESVASCELIVARTSASAACALASGAKNVITSMDIVWRNTPRDSDHLPGLAVALRIPQEGATDEYLERLRGIVRWIAELHETVDFVRIEKPLGPEMAEEGYGTPRIPHTRIFGDDGMYEPFEHIREAIVSCRLHTTIIALLNGNRRILQFQVESGTNKVRDMLKDIGLISIPIFSVNELSQETIEQFLNNPVVLADVEVQSAFKTAREKVEVGLDAFEEWIRRF